MEVRVASIVAAVVSVIVEGVLRVASLTGTGKGGFVPVAVGFAFGYVFTVDDAVYARFDVVVFDLGRTGLLVGCSVSHGCSACFHSE